MIVDDTDQEAWLLFKPNIWHMNNLNCVQRQIERMVQGSPVAEDPTHAENTVVWLLRLKPDADEALQLAAFGHDIERALEGRKVKRDSFATFDDFKRAHAFNSARIVAEIMENCQMEKPLIRDVFDLISQHETGGSKRADILKNADALSFFDVNLASYFSRNTRDEVLSRCVWGYQRLAPHLRRLLAAMKYESRDVEALLREVMAQEENE